MKRTILVLTLTLLLSSAAPAQAAVFQYGNDNPPQPLAPQPVIILLVALLY